MLLDKSFIQGSKKEVITEISKSNEIYICEPFLYEVLKGKKEIRASIFRKLPNPKTEKKYKILPNIVVMLEQEVETKKPFSELVLNNRYYSIHNNLIDPEYSFSLKENDHMKKYKKRVDRGMKALVEHIEVCLPLYKFLIKEAKEKQIDIEKYLISDVSVKSIGLVIERMHDKYRKPEEKSLQLPEIKVLTSDWFYYKFIQVNNLISLKIINKYGNKLDTILKSEKSQEKLRHDYLDSEYLLWALYIKSFASKDKDLNRWFNLLTD